MLHATGNLLHAGILALIVLLVGGLVLLAVAGVAATITFRWHEKVTGTRLVRWWLPVLTLAYALTLVVLASFLWRIHLSGLVILVLVGFMAVATEGLLATRPQRPAWHWRWGVLVVSLAFYLAAAKVALVAYHLLRGHLHGG